MAFVKKSVFHPVSVEGSEGGAESSVQGDTFSPLSPSTAPTSEHVPEHKESKKNFYPVTWRVVGGGVMMSGQRT